MGILEIIEIINKYGFPIITASLFIYIAIIVVETGKKYVNNKLFGTKENKRDLINHQFFDNIRMAIAQLEADKYNITCPYKRYWTRIALPIKFKFYKNLLEAQIGKVIDEESAGEFINKVVSEFWIGVKTYRENMVEKGIPSAYIDSLERYSNATNRTVFEALTYIRNSYLYNSNLDKVRDVLLSFDFANMVCFHDLERMITEMNGELSGKLIQDAEKRGIVLDKKS